MSDLLCTLNVMHNGKTRNNRIYPNMENCTKLKLSSIYGEFNNQDSNITHDGYSLTAIPNMEFNPYEEKQRLNNFNPPSCFMHPRLIQDTDKINIISCDMISIISDYRKHMKYPSITLGG